MKKTKYPTIEDFEDKYIGKRGTPERDEYETTLSMKILGEKIKKIRKENRMNTPDRNIVYL